MVNLLNLGLMWLLVGVLVLLTPHLSLLVLMVLLVVALLEQVQVSLVLVKSVKVMTAEPRQIVLVEAVAEPEVLVGMQLLQVLQHPEGQV
tara:strand:+ start:129 stop:398 length:270 start_codon:yes stop_codon:yes gene_type:complete